jgi:hypothetical protein
LRDPHPTTWVVTIKRRKRNEKEETMPTLTLKHRGLAGAAVLTGFACAALGVSAHLCVAQSPENKRTDSTRSSMVGRKRTTLQSDKIADQVAPFGKDVAARWNANT